MLLTHRKPRPDSQFAGPSFDAPFNVSRAKYKQPTLRASIDVTFGHATGCEYLSPRELRAEYAEHTEARGCSVIRAGIVGDLSAPEFVPCGGMRKRTTYPTQIIKARA